MSTARWEVSSTYVTALISSMKHFGHFEAVHAKSDDAARTLIDTPSAQRWWPATPFASLLATYDVTHGRAALIQSNIHASHSRMGPLVKPLASVLLALAKSPAAALMARLPTFLEAGVKGVQGHFEPAPTGHGGHVRFIFPEPVPEAVSSVWHGLFDFGFSLAKQGRIVTERLEPAVHHYDVDW